MTRLLWLLMLAGTPLVYEVLLYITNKSIRYSNLGKLDLSYSSVHSGMANWIAGNTNCFKGVAEEKQLVNLAVLENL